MSHSIQIRNVPDDVHRTLRARAASAGLSLSDYLARRHRPTRGASGAGRGDQASRFALRWSCPSVHRGGRPLGSRSRLIVVDTSAALSILVGRPEVPGLADRIRNDGDLHAPHLLDVEFQHALHRLARSGALSDDRSTDARTDFADLAIVRYPHAPLADRMWELRHDLTAYDAAFVVLAEILAVPLITCDARLARAPGHHAAVEVFPPG